MGKVVNKIWKADRGDCSRCKHEQECGDYLPDEDKCPANTGGECWAIFESTILPEYERR